MCSINNTKEPWKCGTKKFIAYNAVNLNTHKQKVASYLQNQRATGDQRLCDIELVLGETKEYMHSPVLAAYSDKFAEILMKKAPPLSMDLSKLRSRSVQRSIEFMYNGKTEMCMEYMAEHLKANAYLDIKELHKLLENQLVVMAQDPSRVCTCLNIATEKATKVTEPTSKKILHSMSKLFPLLGTKDIYSLTPSSVCYLVNTVQVSRQEKVNLLNLAINWLRKPEHFSFTHGIVNCLAFPTFTAFENERFRKDLLDCLLTTRDREVVNVGMGRTPGEILIYRDYENYIKNTGAVIQATDIIEDDDPSTSNTYDSVMNLSRASDVQKEINKLPNLFNESRKSCKSRSRSRGPTRFQNRPSSKGRSQSRSPSPFRAQSCNSQTLSEIDSQMPVGVRYTPSEIIEIRHALPSGSKVFEKNRNPPCYGSQCDPSQKRRTPQRTLSELKTSRNNSKHFYNNDEEADIGKTIGKYSTSRAESITSMLDDGSQWPEFQVKKSVQELKRTPSDFEYRPPRTESQMLINARMFTESEVEDLAQLPKDDQLFPTRGSRSRSKVGGACKPGNCELGSTYPCAPCPNRRRSPAPPSYCPSQFSYQSPQGSHSATSIDAIKKLPDVFDKCYMGPSSDNNKQPDFVVGQQQNSGREPQNHTYGKLTRTASEQQEISRLPPVAFANKENKQSQPSQVNSQYVLKSGPTGNARSQYFFDCQY